MNKLNERKIIEIFCTSILSSTYSKKLPHVFLGHDDVSILNNYELSKIYKNRLSYKTQKLVLTCDMLVSSTDVPIGMKDWQIARKSIVASVSDMSSKGISPPYFSMISVGIPKMYTKTKITSLSKGFKKACNEFDVLIVGGDTNESQELVIDCTLIGFTSDKKIPRRNGANIGDLVIVSGEFGYSSSGLSLSIKGNQKTTRFFKSKSIKALMMPNPQQKFGLLLSKYFTSSIDSSDGLAISLYELAKRSSVNISIDKIPTNIEIINFADRNNLSFHDLIFFGGEEYEIVATIKKQDLDIVKHIAYTNDLKLFVIGRVEEGDGKVIINDNAYKDFGFEKINFGNQPSQKSNFSILKEEGYIHFS